MAESESEWRSETFKQSEPSNKFEGVGERQSPNTGDSKPNMLTLGKQEQTGGMNTEAEKHKHSLAKNKGRRGS